MLDALRPGAIWAQMGTIGIQGTEALTAIVSVQRGDVLFVDAPVSGTRGLAESGELPVLGTDKPSSCVTWAPLGHRGTGLTRDYTIW